MRPPQPAPQAHPREWFRYPASNQPGLGLPRSHHSLPPLTTEHHTRNKFSQTARSSLSCSPRSFKSDLPIHREASDLKDRQEHSILYNKSHQNSSIKPHLILPPHQLIYSRIHKCTYLLPAPQAINFSSRVDINIHLRTGNPLNKIPPRRHPHPIHHSLQSIRNSPPSTPLRRNRNDQDNHPVRSPPYMEMAR